MLRPTRGDEGEKYYQLITSCYLYQKRLVVFYEKSQVLNTFESWAIKAKKMLAVLDIPEATESEAFYEEHDIDDVLSQLYD
jgi:predicted restriction endonuclease